MHTLNKAILLIVSAPIIGCMSSENVNNDYQMRMQRCEQYIGDMRERCMRGELVTLDDYNHEYQDFKKSIDAKANRTPVKKDTENNTKKPQEKEPPQS